MTRPQHPQGFLQVAVFNQSIRGAWGLYRPDRYCSVRRRIAREQVIELAFGLELEKVVGTTDVRAVDEDLRHCVAPRSFPHGLSMCWICLDIDLIPLHSFFLEERHRPSAKRAPTRCVQEDIRFHIASLIIDF